MPDKIRICHMTSVHNSADVRIFQKECRSLAAAGYGVYLVAPGKSRSEDGVEVIGVGDKPGRLRRMTTYARRVYRAALALDCAVYHLHDPELLPYALKLKRKGKRVIFDSHENYALQIAQKRYLAKPFRMLTARAYGAYEAHVLRRIDAVITPCTFEGKNIFDGVARRTCLVNNYPVPAVFSCRREPLQAEEAYIFYAGSLTQNRGVTTLVEAAALSGVRLALAGSFSPAAYEEELRRMPAYAAVDYKGFVAQAEVARLCSRALAGMCTLPPNGQYDKFDTLGTKVYEYMAMGLPVILSDYPYARKLMETCEFGMCTDPTSPQAIADAIRYIQTHPEAAERMGDNGRRAVEREFNWGAEGKKLCALYAELIQGARL